jgi:tetratricopeptide (TPR) repeat protein
MSRLIYPRVGKINLTALAFLALVALPLAGCGSPQQRAQAYYESGMKLLAAHEDQKAAVEFRNALRLRKDLLPAWRGLAQTEEDTHHWQGFASVLRTILDLDPKDEATRIKLAKFLLAAGAADQSLKLVNESSEPDTNNASLLALKAVIYYKLKDSDTALRDAHAALKIEPGNVDALVVLAADRLANNDPNGALQILASHPQTQDQDLGTQLFKLKIYAQLKDYAQLESLLQSLAKRDPHNLAFRKDLANLYMSQHRSDDAEKELRAIVAADPKNSQSGLDLIRFLFKVKGPAAARAELVARIKAGGDIFPYQLALAEFDFDQGKVDDSFKLLNTLSNSSSSTQAIKAKLMLAQLNLRQKNADAAEKIVDGVLAEDQRNVEALKLRAAIRLQRNQVDGAIADLREALNDQPRSPDLMLMLSNAYERSGSIDLADKELADAMKASKFNPIVGLEYVAFLRRRGGSDRAYDVLTELANRWPNDTQVLSMLAGMRLQRHDWAGAEQIAEKMKNIGNAGVVSDQILGAALSGEHKYDASITAFQNAVAAAPTATQPMVALVAALVDAKQTDKAIKFLQAALKKDPNNAQAYLLLGNIDISSNLLNQAEQNFKAAIASQPKSDIGYEALSKLYLRQNKSDAALDVIQTGLKKQPDSANLHMALASIFERKGNYEGAISEYDYLLKQHAGSLVVINNLASLLADHRTDKASLKRAESLALSLQDSPVAQFKDTLGWIYNREGHFKESVRLLEEASAGLPDSAIVHYHLGMSYIAVGQFTKASDQLKEALNQTSNGDLQNKIKAGLKDIVKQ